MRTQGQLLSDTPHTGGRIWIGPFDIENTANSFTNTVWTRNAAGDYSINQVASVGPFYYVADLSNMKRILELVTPPAFQATTAFPNASPVPFQEEFGAGNAYPGSVDAAGQTSPTGTAGPSAQMTNAPGLPPFLGITQLTVPTGQPPKGIRVISFNYIYLVTGAALTTHTVNLYRTTYANNVALSVATLTLTGTPATATQANPYVTTFTVSAPVFENTDLTSLAIEVAVTTAASGAYRFYGILLNADFNFT